MAVDAATITPIILNAIAQTGCPIVGVSVGDPNTPATWKITFSPSATTTQQNAATAAVAAINLTAVTQLSGLPALRAAGFTITSTGTPALNGTYAIDNDAQLRILAQMVYIIKTSNFSNGTTSKKWPDINGAIKTFNVTQFTNFATAVEKYLEALDAVAYQLAAGTVVAWPTASATIA